MTSNIEADTTETCEADTTETCEVGTIDTNLVDSINNRRINAYHTARDAPSELGAYFSVEEWDFRPEFTYHSLDGEQTCSCGNVFCRPVSCELCVGKCLGQDYEREIVEDCTGWDFGHSCCCECDGCGYHPEQYKLPDPIPITVSCLSSCSCANDTK